MSAADYAILFAYLAAMVGIGVWFSGGQDSEEEFLMGGRRMHWLLVSLASVATAFSGVSLIGAPGYVFSHDTQMAMAAPIGLLTLPVILIMLPYLVRLRITTVYEYLETRFSLGLRLTASALFLATKFVYVGVVIYTPALLISTAVGIPLLPSILLMGLIATLLTMLGGMKAVMWSDAVQFGVMMLGISIILAILAIPDASGQGGFLAYWSAADAAGKIQYWNFSWNWSELTTWSIIVCMTMAGIGSTFSDQVMMQRYFAAGDARAVARSFWTSSVISLFAVMLLYLLGVLLFGFYGTGQHALPEEIRTQGDRVLPYFVSTQLPIGLRGLVISAIIAATLSTVSSVLNSLCTATMTDFLERLEIRAPAGLSAVAMSRWITVAWGGAGTALACYVGRFGTIIEQTQTLFGLVGGPLGGIFFLGLFTKRAHAVGTACGAALGIAATAGSMQVKALNFMWYYPVGMAVCVAAGYAISLVFPKKTS